jgi:hypothetical protein
MEAKEYLNCKFLAFNPGKMIERGECYPYYALTFFMITRNT